MLRTCTLCPSIIPPQHVLCHSCFPQYRQYMREDWFQELIRMQVRQDYISFREASYLNESSVGVALVSTPLQRKPPGRPRKLTRAAEDRIVHLYEEAFQRALEGIGKRLSFREIAREFDCNRMTVQRIIYRRGNSHMVDQLKKERNMQ